MAKNKSEPAKPWVGRFTEATDEFVEAFTASVGFDRALAAYDIAGSLAHATMLGKVGVLTADELAAIKSGLEDILPISRPANSNGPWRWKTCT